MNPPKTFLILGYILLLLTVAINAQEDSKEDPSLGFD